MQKFYWISKFLNRVFLKLMMLGVAGCPRREGREQRSATEGETSPSHHKNQGVTHMEKETTDRITAIEMKLAYMEDFVNQIQNVAVEQAKTIDKLEKEIKLMADKMCEMSDTMEGDIPNRRPPHY